MKDLNKIYFPGKEPEEKIIMALRRHPVVIVHKLLLIFIVGVVPVVAALGLRQYTSWLDDASSLLYLVLILVAGLFYLYWLLFLFESWVNYYLDVWVITGERIIAMEQVSLFHRDVSELRLNTIQDVSSNVRGLLASFFRYGDILVQTASAEKRFQFKQVPHPEIVARSILELREHYAGDDRLSPHQHQENEAPPRNNNAPDENQQV
jgi:hypothetical protein